MDPVPHRSHPRCGVCGNGLRTHAKFCDACGSPVRASHAGEERKQITVLFADVVESMTLAAMLGSERLREIMYQLLNRSAAVVQRYQGTIDKFTGDGLMALFGAPVALEDHALRACIAALEIQSVARMLADEVRARDNVELRLRVGLNSGEVIAGEMGVGPRSYTVVGHAVGMAQRMESAADAGGILCSESTARLAEPSAVFGPMELVAVKGGGEPVPARRLERVESDRSVLGRNDGPLVGRDAEMAQLLDVFEAKETSVVGMIGALGVGKSRLIREFTAAAHACGAETVVMRCESHTAHVPLHALSRMVRAMFGVRGLDNTSARARVTEQLQRVADTAPGDGHILFDLLSIGDAETPAPTMSAAARRGRLVELMARVAGARSARTIFIVEEPATSFSSAIPRRNWSNI